MPAVGGQPPCPLAGSHATMASSQAPARERLLIHALVVASGQAGAPVACSLEVADRSTRARALRRHGAKLWVTTGLRCYMERCKRWRAAARAPFTRRLSWWIWSLRAVFAGVVSGGWDSRAQQWVSCSLLTFPFPMPMILVWDRALRRMAQSCE
jgi:hypothetical protein